jgi:WW domain-containing oxidoreductase
MALPKLEQVGGIEKQFATNHLGHFLLVNLLRSQLDAADAARVVVVSSAAHFQAPRVGIEFDNLSGERGYSSWRAYGQSKLANVLFVKGLARRLRPSHSANALHPGVIATNLARSMSSWVSRGLNLFVGPFSKTIPQGAATTCYVATRPELQAVTGEYFSNCAVARRSRHSQDDALVERLWEVSEQLTGLR